MSAPIDELVTALDAEAQAHHGRYMELAARAGDMGYPQAAKLLRAIVSAETARLGLYRHSLTELGSSAATYDYCICPKCGLAMTEAPPNQCPLCQTPGTSFDRIT